MKKIVISNAFSLNMIKDEKAVITFQRINLREVKYLIKRNPFISIVGHTGTAEVFSNLLEVKIPANRTFYKLEKEDILIIGSLNTRLPEGKILSKEELQNIEISFWKVEILKKKGGKDGENS